MTKTAPAYTHAGAFALKGEVFGMNLLARDRARGHHGHRLDNRFGDGRGKKLGGDKGEQIGNPEDNPLRPIAFPLSDCRRS